MSFRPARRRGYAMITVLVFLAVLMTTLGVTHRHMASLLRREQAQWEVDRFDAGPRCALARGVALLETGLPPDNPYTCITQIITPEGEESFTVSYRKVSGHKWRVEVAPTAPGEHAPAMPPTFFDEYEE
jgi:hypothetical protein